MRDTPRVSVLMATYNGARYIRQSIDGILTQTFRNFELIVLDDSSTDATPDILAGYDDPRLRVLRNERNAGVVNARNRLFAAARGDYIALLDHDDLSRPTRLARQVAYLDANPTTALVGTDAHVLENGRISPTKHPATMTPLMVRFLLEICNPLICSSVMFRAATVRDLGTFMRADYEYADDYDLYHRASALGEIARINDKLTIYRRHAGNTFKKYEETMVGNAAKVLAQAYVKWFGPDAIRAATLVARHVTVATPVPDLATLDAVAGCLERLIAAFTAEHRIDPATDAQMRAYIAATWWSLVSALPPWRWLSAYRARPKLALGIMPPARTVARASLSHLPVPDLLRSIRALGRRRVQRPLVAAPARLFGRTVRPIVGDPEALPTLFVVVDTEAEFDWSQPFARDQTSVTAMAQIERGQIVFDRYGLRPTYVIDYPVASHPEGYRPLLRILDRAACAIGAHLQPWTTPPFTETPSDHNSYAGNLEPPQEEEKLVHLIRTIRENLGVEPLFYKAGRYGIGPRSFDLLVRHGIRVDFSIMPGADLRRRGGGPDFRALHATPYRVEPADPLATSLLSVPMTRDHVGLLAPFGTMLQPLVGSNSAKSLFRLPAVLARLRLLDTITLTPEGVTAKEQIRLIRAMLRHGHRQFVLHYHSPSLVPGNTDYVRTAADAEDFVARISEVCRFFFETVGGLPGDPTELLRLAAHSAAPARAAAQAKDYVTAK